MTRKEVDDLNDLLDKHWPGLADGFFQVRLASMVKQSSDLPLPITYKGKQLGTLDLEIGYQLTGQGIVWKGLKENQPGFEESAGNQIRLAFPRDGKTWGVSVDGSLVVSRTAGPPKCTKEPPPEPIELLRATQKFFLDGFRVVLHATLDNVTDGRPDMSKTPVVRNLVLEPGLRLRLEGVIAGSVDITPNSITLITEGDVRTWKQNFNGLEIKGAAKVFGAGVATFGGSLELRWGAQPKLILTGRVSVGGVSVYTLQKPLEIPLPGSLVTFGKILTWGEDRNKFPTIGREHVDFDTTGKFARLAGEIEERLLKRHNIFARNVPDGQTPDMLIVTDNRYPREKIKPCQQLKSDLYHGSGDSAIWTGHLLAAEAFRYAVAQRDDGVNSEPAKAARANIGRVLAGLEKMLEVPAQFNAARKRGLLCRCALPDSLAALTQEFETVPGCKEKQQYSMRPEPGNRAWEVSQFGYYSDVDLGGGERWHGKGRDYAPPSRDSHTGVFFGLAAVYKLCADDNEATVVLRKRAKGMIEDMLTFLLKNGWNVPTPMGPATVGQDPAKVRVETTYALFFNHILALLAVGRMTEGDAGGTFTTVYDDLAPKVAKFAWLTLWTDCLNPVSKYYKFNLHHIVMGLLLWLAPEGGEKVEYRRAFDILRRTTGHHRNPHFHLLYLLGLPEAERNKELDEKDALGSRAADGKKLTLRDEIQHCLYEWQRRLIPETGNPGPSCLPLALTRDLKYFRERFSTGETNVLSDTQTFSGGDLLTLGAQTADKRIGNDLDFLWQRDPFGTGMNPGGFFIRSQSRGDTRGGAIEAPGVDYLLPYYMGRYLKVFAKK